MRRHTFVVQVHPDGISTLENLSTHERLPISDLASVGRQIEFWLSEQREAKRSRPPDSERVQPGSTPG